MSKSEVSNLEVEKLVESAIKATKEAGTYLLHRLGSAKIEYGKTERDDLLDVDLEAEHIILTILREETPNVGIQSEEAGQSGRKDLCWIIDPLDGSANFQHSSPMFAVAIALEKEKETLGAVIYIPARDELFTAIKNGGAHLNGKAIHVSNIANLKDAIVHFGDFTKNDDLIMIETGLKDFSKLAEKVRRIRMIGSASMDLAYIASGRADALINHTNNPWDVEPGRLILLEAGGKVTTRHHNNSRPLSIYTNNALHNMIDTLFTDR